VDLFLWVLQGGGVSIALLGLGRERRMRDHRLGLGRLAVQQRLQR
jgi:hypothetical protein